MQDITYNLGRMELDDNIREVAPQRRWNLVVAVAAMSFGIWAFYSWYKYRISLQMMYAFVFCGIALVIVCWIKERRLWQSISKRRSYGFPIETKGNDA